MKVNYRLWAVVGTVSFAFVADISPAKSQQASGEFSQLQALLAARKWYEADQETASLLRNNSENLSCPNLSNINQLWANYSNGKYGFTPQMQLWQQVGGLKCKTCENEIKKFSEKVGWNLSDQINTIPGDFVGQYPTVATLGWQRYVNSDRSFLSGGLFSKRTWQDWKMTNFNIFSIVKNCQGQNTTRVKK